jgi:hypothetical protein
MKKKIHAPDITTRKQDKTDKLFRIYTNGVNRVHPRRTLHKKIHVNSAYLWFKIQFSIYSGFAQLKTD